MTGRRVRRFPAVLWPALLSMALTVGGLPASEPPSGHKQPRLPSGHPQVANPKSSESVLPQVPAGSGTGAAALSWEVPANWIAEKPSSSMRRAQYRIARTPDSAGDAECVVYYFGPGQGGDARSNAERWADQFAQPDGRSSREVMKTEELDAGGLPVLSVEVTGIYGGGMATMSGSRELAPDYMLLGAIAQGSDANWFFKLTGPRKTVSTLR